VTTRISRWPIDRWRILIGAGIVAVVWLVLLTDPLLANDCIEYVKKPTNFVGIPKALIEDCMRTGNVQAIVTGIIAVLTGGTIVTTVNRALGGKGGTDTATPGDAGIALGGTVVAGGGGEDGGEGGGEGGGDPSNPPEGPGGQQTRDGTPEACRRIWDDLQTAIGDVKNTEYLIEICQKHLQKAIDNKQNNLAKVTIQLGADAANAATAGAGGVKGAMGIAKGLAEAPEFLQALANAATRANGIGEALANVLQEIATITGNVGRFSAGAAEAGRLSAAAESKIAELVKAAAAMEGEVESFDEMVGFARAADSTLLERNAVEQSAAAMEQALADAQAEREAVIAERAALEEWAEGERAAIAEDNTRAFNRKHEELGDLRTKIEAMKAEHAERAKVAHAEWQAKMSELSTAKKELDEARAMTAHLQQARTDLLMAEQEARRVAALEGEVEARLAHAEEEVLAFDQAEKNLEAANKAILELEADEQDLVNRMKVIDEAAEARSAFLEAETAEDTASAAVDEAGREMQVAIEADTELGALENEVKRLEHEVHVRDEQWKEAFLDHVNKDEELKRIMNMGVDADGEEVMHGRTPTSAELREVQAAAREEEVTRKALAVAKRELGGAQLEVTKAQTDGRFAEAAARKNAAQAKLTAAREKLSAASADLDRAGKKYQGYDHAGIDINGKSRLEAERARIQQDITKQKYEAAKNQVEGNRIDRENKVVDAKEEMQRVKNQQVGANNKVQECKSNLDMLDTTGTGEPSGRLHQFEGAQARYLELSKEQEALRVRYEEYASGAYSNPAEAAAIRARMDELETEIHNWREPDVGSEMARRNPQKYQEYTSAHADNSKIPGLENKIGSLTTQVKDLGERSARLGQTLSTLQAKTGGASVDALQGKLVKAKADLASNQSDTSTARSEKQQQDQSAVDNDAKAKAEQAKLADAEARKRDLENQKHQADADLEALKAQQREKFNDASTAGWMLDKMGKKWVMGDNGEWTPYHGSGAEDIANASHTLRQRWDDNYEATTPQWEKDLNKLIKAPFQWTGQKVGEGFHWAFGGSQSPEEIAAILKNDVALVEKYSAKLAELQGQYSNQVQRAKSLGNDLEVCKTNNA
jgi:chromosome segregation ATPase